MIHIRQEKTADIARISEINRMAFGGEAESNLVAAIRGSENFIPELSLVAVLDGRLVGHILFSGISILGAETTHQAVALAPMAVLPEYQRQGIGSSLVLRGLEECKRLREKIVVVIGHPEYYPRFGFQPARKLGLDLEFDVPDEAFMALELEAGSLRKMGGVVRYPPAFNEAV